MPVDLAPPRRRDPKRLGIYPAVEVPSSATSNGSSLRWNCTVAV